MSLGEITRKPGKGACALAVVMAFASAASATSTNSWKSAGRVNDWDWTEPGNFTEGVAPEAGDAVRLPASTDIFVTNAASLSLVATLDQVFTASGARIIFSVEEGETVSVDCAICSAARHEDSSAMTGEIVKRGLGTLILARSDGHPEQNNTRVPYCDRQAYKTCITCEEGVLKLPTSAETGGYSHFMGRLSVSNNATVFTVAGNGNYTVPIEIWGSGTLTNDNVTKNATLRVNGSSAYRSEFSGSIGGAIYYQSYGNVTLTGINTFTNGLTAYASSRIDIDNLAAHHSQTRLKKIGMKSENTSIPRGLSLATQYSGGRFVYIGDEDDVTDRGVWLAAPKEGPSILDAGHHGGITFTGPFSMVTGSPQYEGMALLCLAGSNEVPCVMSGSIKQYSTNDFFLVTVGSGTWRLADTTDSNKSRTFGTTITLKEGTLQFDSLVDARQYCSLGMSTNWSAAYYGRHSKAYVTNYAFLAGAAYGSARPATLEFTGTNRSVAVATRPLGMIGDLSLKNDTAKAWRFSGVENVAGKAVTLDLTGSAATNELYGIRDTAAAPISVTKTGSGTWTLDGSNTIHGAISVKGGTLKVREVLDGNYTWFRFTIRDRIGSAEYYMHFKQLGIYDAEGHRINLDLSTNNTDCAALAPGQIAYGRDRIIWYGTKSLPQIVNGSTSYLEFRDADKVSPTPGNPVTWLPFVMRLPKGSAAADTYDVCLGQSYNATDGNQNRVFTNWMMEGSVDGLHWDILSETNNAQPLANVWVGSGVAYSGASSDTTHLNGMKLARSGIGEIATTVLDDVKTVSVATNCTLEAEGDVTLKALTLDANGNGTIKGFAFAESGTVDVAGLGVGVKEATFDITFEDVTGLQNIKSWNLTVNGGRAVNRRLVVEADGTVRLIRRGLSVVVR